MRPRELFTSARQSGRLLPDPAQEQAVVAFQALHQRLTAADRPISWSSRLRRVLTGAVPAQPVTGLYLWGGVGRGKTLLMDLFHQALPFEAKRRLHFHRFMRDVHRQLDELKGQPDPLPRIAARFAADYRVLCLDEFMVSDIADAMILSGLLQALFQAGVCLIATSNQHPEQLYLHGLQRDRFAPAIGLILQHSQVLELDGGQDYRLRYLDTARTYHLPPGAEADRALSNSFEELAPGHAVRDTRIEVAGRSVPVRRGAEDVAWFDFEVLCGGPRSQNDYMELARCFHTLLISDVPAMQAGQDDRAARFVHLIDQLYERRVKLLLSAEAPATELYQGRNLAQPFLRTISRLQEMQSHHYMAEPHRP